MLSGQTTQLRAIEPKDLEPLRIWRNKPEFRRYFREYREISVEMQEAWYRNSVLNDPRVRMFAIEDKSGRLLGACGLCYIDAINRSADFSIYIGADDLYIDDVFAPDAGRTLIAYGFAELNLHRIWAEIYDFDLPKQALFPKLGFTLEGRHRQTHWSEGQWSDSLFYGLLASERTGA